MKFSSNDKKKSRVFALLTYATAFLTVISIILQAINQYLILPHNIQSILNNLIIITIVFLAITLFLLIISFLPIFIYKRRTINFSLIKRRKDTFSPVVHNKEDLTFAKNPIKYFIKSLQDDEIKETLK